MSSANNGPTPQELSASAAATSTPIDRADAIGDDNEACDDDGFIDLNDPANMVFDDDEGVHEDDEDLDDGEEEENKPEEQLLGDDGEPLPQGANLNEEGDNLPPVDDCAAVFYDPEAIEKVFLEEDEHGNPLPPIDEEDDCSKEGRPYYNRVKPLHAIAAHPKHNGIVAVGGESDIAYIVEYPTAEVLAAKAAAKAQLRPPADLKDSSHLGPTFEYGVDPADLIAAKTTLKGHTDTITTMAFSPQGDILATGSIDTTVKLWNVETGELVHSLEDLSGEVECLLWHPSGLALLAGAQDAQTIMWNAKKGQVAMYYCGHRGTVTQLLWASDYKKVLSCSADGSVMLFNAKSSEVEMAITKGLSDDQAGVVSMALLPTTAGIAAASASPATTTAESLTAASDILVVGTEDGTMYVINLSSKKVVQKLTEVHSQAVEAVVACSDPNYVTICPFFVSVSCDCTIAVWNARDFTCRSHINIGEGILTARWFRESIMVGCSDGVVRFFETRTFLEQQTYDVPFQKEKRFGDDEDAETFHTFGNKGSRALFGHRRMIFKMVVNASNDALVTVSDDGTARVFGLTA